MGKLSAGRKGGRMSKKYDPEKIPKEVMERSEKMSLLKILFPALMVIGAFGSLVVNIVSKGDSPTSLQWIGACLLYTALMLRNRE